MTKRECRLSMNSGLMELLALFCFFVFFFFVLSYLSFDPFVYFFSARTKSAKELFLATFVFIIDICVEIRKKLY